MVSLSVADVTHVRLGWMNALRWSAIDNVFAPVAWLLFAKSPVTQMRS